MPSTRPAPRRPRAARPRVGFLGAGWIGRHRLRALCASGLVEAVAVADPDAAARRQAAAEAGGIRACADLSELLELRLDALVIATPSALHASQALGALDRDLAVFCQKPLGRNAAETAAVVERARTRDRLLAVDLSYRHARAVEAARRLAAGGGLGRPYALDLVFDNAYGPDKPWFDERELAGGGCLIDLGTHLVDLALWLTGAGGARVEWARLLRHGERIGSDAAQSETFAAAELELDGGVSARLRCSWFLPAGRDCVFECTLYGTDGAVSVRNVEGSFYDFRAEHRRGTSSSAIAQPGDDWGAGAIVAWASRLADSPRHAPELTDGLLPVSRVIDDVYAWS